MAEMQEKNKKTESMSVFEKLVGRRQQNREIVKQKRDRDIQDGNVYHLEGLDNEYDIMKSRVVKAFENGDDEIFIPFELCSSMRNRLDSNRKLQTHVCSKLQEDLGDQQDKPYMVCRPYSFVDIDYIDSRAYKETVHGIKIFFNKEKTQKGNNFAIKRDDESTFSEFLKTKENSNSPWYSRFF